MLLPKLGFPSFKETHSGEAGEHRQTEESSRLPLRKIRGAVNEISEGAIADFLRSIFHIVGAGIDAARGKWRIVFECMGRFPDIASKRSDEVGSGSLLLLGLILEMVRGSGRNFLGSIGRFLEFVARRVGRCPQRVAGALFDSAPASAIWSFSFCESRRFSFWEVAGVKIHIAHGRLYSAVRVSGGIERGRHDVVGHFFEPFGDALGDPAGVSPESASATLLAAASAADSTAVLGGLGTGLCGTRRGPLNAVACPRP